MSIGHRVRPSTKVADWVNPVVRPSFFPPTLTTDTVATASSSRTSTSCTASATPHTEGTLVVVDAALTEECCGITSMLTTATGSGGVDTSTLLEICIGGAGVETVWATIPVGYVNGTNIPIFIPGYLASGERVTIRARSAVASQAVTVRMYFHASRGYTNFGTPLSLGVDTTTSRGLALTAPVSLNSESAWTELTSSLTKDITAVYLGIQGNGGLAMSGTGILVDIGKGAAGSEQVIVQDVYFLGGTAENYLPLAPTTYQVLCYAGERLVLRYARANTGNAVDAIVVAA